MTKDPTSDRRSPADSAQGAVRRAGLRALAATLPKVTKRALGKRGFADAGLLADWPAVVGREIAERCVPRKLARARPGGREAGTLTLKVEPGAALELQHLEPLLIERINAYLGYRAVGRLRFLQGRIGTQPARTPSPPPTPQPGAERALRGRLESVEDPDVRAALEGLGRAVLERRD
jgi:hypothetical protein